MISDWIAVAAIVVPVLGAIFIILVRHMIEDTAAQSSTKAEIDELKRRVGRLECKK